MSKLEKLKQHYKDQTVWVIGASDGIGQQAVLDLHKLGAKPILSARSTDKLKEISQSINGVPFYPLDVGNAEKFSETINTVFKAHSVDRVIYLPAYYEPMKLGRLNRQDVELTVTTNLTAVFYLIELMMPKLKQIPKLQLAVCGSVAGYFGLPYAQPYAATKAGVISLMQSLKAEYASYDLKLINPGFVKTKLTEKNTFQMPSLIPPEEASYQILKGLTKPAFEVHFPKRFTRTLKMINLLPYKVFFKVMKKIGG